MNILFLILLLLIPNISHATSWKIDDLYTFTTTTNGSAGIVDADSVPTYRIYEDETGTAVLTGSMAKLDDAGTTGFYSEQITLSAANGFEKGKSYNVIICAAISSTTACATEIFQIEMEVDANIVSDKTGYTASTVSDKSGYSLAADQSAVTIGTVTTYTGNTPQTGDAYAIVNNGTYGNSALNTKINTIDDFLDTEIASIIGYMDTEIADILADTADMQPKLGTPAGASMSADIAAIEAQTDDIGAAGAGLTALATQSSVNTLAGYVDTEVAAIVTVIGTPVTTVSGDLATLQADTDDLQLRALSTTAMANAEAAFNGTGYMGEGIAVTVASVGSTMPWTISIAQTDVITVDNQFVGSKLNCGKEFREIVATDQNTADTITVEIGRPFDTEPINTCYIK